MNKNILIIALLSILNLSCALSQDKKKVHKYKIKSQTVSVMEDGQIRKISFERYDAAGNVIEEVNYNKEGIVKKKILTKYNNENRKSEEEEYGIKGGLIRKTVYSYNNFGEKTEEVVYDGNGALIEKNIYTYDKKGLKIEKKTLGEGSKETAVKTFSFEY
jgi:hypothetical protein